MFRFVIISLLTLSLQTAVAQKRTKTYTLKEPLEKISYSRYNKIVVLDKRDVQENLGIVQVGVLNSKAQVIAQPSLSSQIQEQLPKIVSGELQDGELVLRLEKFCIAELTGMVSEAGYFDFTGILFAKVADDAYVEIGMLDTAVVIKRMDVTLGILNSSSKIVNTFLAKNLQREAGTGEKLTLAEVNHYDAYLKKDMPLYEVAKLKNGLYKNFEEFKLQQPSGGNVLLKKNDLKRGVFKQNEDGKLKKIAFKDCYAFVINNIAYINCLNNYLPLEKNNNEFCFIGPAKVGATASDMVAASLLLGAVGGAIAGSGSLATYYQKLDYRNGRFIRLERR